MSAGRPLAKWKSSDCPAPLFGRNEQARVPRLDRRSLQKETVADGIESRQETWEGPWGLAPPIPRPEELA